MSKRAHHYRLTLEHLADAKPDQAPHAPLTLEFDNHDNIFSIVERMQQANYLPPSDAAELALGIKLLGEVLLRHRDHPLFSELGPAFREFMPKLKAQGKPAGE